MTIIGNCQLSLGWWVTTRALNLWRRNRELREKHPIVTILAPYRLQEFCRAFNHHFKNEFWNINCPAGVSNTLLHHQIKGLALAQCPVFSLSMQIFLLSDSLSYPQRVSYYLTLFHMGLTYYFHDIGYSIIYPIVNFAYRKVKKYPIRSSRPYPSRGTPSPPIQNYLVSSLTDTFVPPPWQQISRALYAQYPIICIIFL